jgi:hypothetical protein
LDSLSTYGNARDDALIKSFFLALFICTGLLLADGGTVQFRGPAGPFEVTVFASPAPVRIGSTDLSVLIKKPATDATVLDADVSFHLVKSVDGKIIEVTTRATHDKATNKLLYAANTRIPANGSWRVDVLIKQGGTAAQLSGRMQVLPPQPPLEKYWAYFALLPLLAILFAISQRLKRQRRRSVRSSR